MDQFPLDDETTRAMSHNADENDETNLLLDPCTDEPEVFLGHNIVGEIFPVNNSLRGKCTIEICNLNRRRIKDNRQKIISITMRFYLLSKKLEEEGNVEAADELMSLMQTELLAENLPYSGAGQAVVNDPDAFGV